MKKLAEIGDPNCKLTSPYKILGKHETDKPPHERLVPWLSDYTDDTELMMSSESILTLVEIHKALIDAYLKLRHDMRFYTNVFQIGNYILVRGYEDGKHFSDRTQFHPTFYVPTKKKSKWKTLDNVALVWNQ